MVLKQKTVRCLRNQNKRKHQALRRKQAQIQRWMASTIEGKLVTSIVQLSPIIKAKPQDVKQPKKNKAKKPKAKVIPVELSQPSTSEQPKPVAVGKGKADEKDSSKIESPKVAVKETQNGRKNKPSEHQEVADTMNEINTSVLNTQPPVDKKPSAQPESTKEDMLPKHQKNNKNKKGTSQLVPPPVGTAKQEQMNVEGAGASSAINESVKQVHKKETVGTGQLSKEKTPQREAEMKVANVKPVDAVPTSVKDGNESGAQKLKESTLKSMESQKEAVPASVTAGKESGAQKLKESTPKLMESLKEANANQLKTSNAHSQKSKEPTPTPAELLMKEDKVESFETKRFGTSKSKGATPTPTELPKQENGSHQNLLEPEFKYQKLNKKDKMKKNKSQSQEPNSVEVGEREKPEVIVNQLQPPDKETKVGSPEIAPVSVEVPKVNEPEWKQQKPNKKDRKKKNSGSDSRAETPKPVQSAKTESIFETPKVDVPAVKVEAESAPYAVREELEKSQKANAGSAGHRLDVSGGDGEVKKQTEEKNGKNNKKRNRKHKKSESDAYTQQPQKSQVTKNGRKKSFSESVHEQKKTLIKAEVEEFSSDRSPTLVVPVNQPLAVETEKLASITHDNRQDTKCSVDSGVDVLCCGAPSTNNLGSNGSAVGANMVNNSDDNDSRRSTSSFITTSDHLEVPRRGGKNKSKQSKQHTNDVERKLIKAAQQRDTNFAKTVVELVGQVQKQLNGDDAAPLLRNVENGKRRTDDKFSNEQPQAPIEEKIVEPQPVECQQEMVTECVVVSQVARSRPPIILKSADFADLKLTVAQPPPTPIVREKRERVHRLLDSDVEFCTYMMEKYGDDYESMSSDERNIFMDNASAIARKIRIFRETPQYKDYLERKQQIVT